MIHYKSKEEIELIRESSLLVGKTLAEVAKLIRPGLQTIELDKVAEQFIRDNQAVPGFLGYNGFPFTLCISVNDQVVHGFPGKYELMEGDIVSVDCGVIKNGFYGDSAYTFPVGEVRQEVLLLMKRTKESLYKGIEMATDGKRVGDIGFAVQSHVEAFGYGVVRDLVGHGVGRNLHEKPEVPNYGRRGSGV
jgi:methionyl aminopeptidase